MDILITNIDEIYTGDSNHQKIENGSISIKDNKIDRIDVANIYDEAKYDRIIDGSGKIALPGLINTHTHSAMTLLRGYADDLPLQKWLQEKIWPFEAGLSSKDIYWGSKLAIMEMLSTGTTTFADMYFQMDFVAEVVEETGIRAVLSEGLIERNDGLDGLNSALEFSKRWQNGAGGRITTMLAPHSPYTCSEDYLKRIVELAEKNNLAVNIHLSETEEEYRNSIKSSSLTPTAYLKSIGMFERPVVAAHCVYLSEDDFDILAENNVGVAYNPASNMKLSSGIADVVKMIDSGINVALGSDGVASNNNLDMVEEARLGSYLQKVSSNDPTVLNIGQLFDMLTINGAEILGLKKLGRLQNGYKADLILVNTLKRSNFYPHHNNLSNLFYSGNGNDVDTVIVDGKIVFQDNNFVTIDKEEVYYEVEKIVNEK